MLGGLLFAPTVGWLTAHRGCLIRRRITRTAVWQPMTQISIRIYALVIVYAASIVTPYKALSCFVITNVLLEWIGRRRKGYRRGNLNGATHHSPGLELPSPQNSLEMLIFRYSGTANLLTRTKMSIQAMNACESSELHYSD
jgi:hypothetical protein